MTSAAVIGNFGHLQEAIDAVEQRIKDVTNGTANKIKASSGLIITKINDKGDIEILMGRLNKLNRHDPKDPAGVHGSYGIFSGNIELSDAGKQAPAVMMAAAREVNEESLGALSEEKILELLSLPTTKLIKNAGWKHFTAASFLVNISSDLSEKIVNVFKSKIENNPQHEISELAWVPLKQIVEAQVEKENEYNALRQRIEQNLGKPLSNDELLASKELGDVYNKNLKLASGISVAHYIARTIFNIKDNLSN